MTPKYYFGQIVIVEKNLIGVIVECWDMAASVGHWDYDVYVRKTGKITRYGEPDVGEFSYDAELSPDYLERHK